VAVVHHDQELRWISQEWDLPEKVQTNQADKRHGAEVDHEMFQPPKPAKTAQRATWFGLVGSVVVWRRWGGGVGCVIDRGGPGVGFYGAERASEIF